MLFGRLNPNEGYHSYTSLSRNSAFASILDRKNLDYQFDPDLLNQLELHTGVARDLFEQFINTELSLDEIEGTGTTELMRVLKKNFMKVIDYFVAPQIVLDAMRKGSTCTDKFYYNGKIMTDLMGFSRLKKISQETIDVGFIKCVYDDFRNKALFSNDLQQLLNRAYIQGGSAAFFLSALNFLMVKLRVDCATQNIELPEIRNHYYNHFYTTGDVLVNESLCYGMSIDGKAIPGFVVIQEKRDQDGTLLLKESALFASNRALNDIVLKINCESIGSIDALGLIERLIKRNILFNQNLPPREMQLHPMTERAIKRIALDVNAERFHVCDMHGAYLTQKMEMIQALFYPTSDEYQFIYQNMPPQIDVTMSVTENELRMQRYLTAVNAKLHLGIQKPSYINVCNALDCLMNKANAALPRIVFWMQNQVITGDLAHDDGLKSALDNMTMVLPTLANNLIDYTPILQESGRLSSLRRLLSVLCKDRVPAVHQVLNYLMDPQVQSPIFKC